MNTKEFELLITKIDELQNEAIEVMSKLISIDSVGPKNDGPGEKGKADFIIEYLNKSGIQNIKNYPAPDPKVNSGERPNLVVTLEGRDISRTLWIL